MLYRSIGFGTPAYQDLGSTALGAQREIIEKVASEGPCVIVGRMADQVLKGKYPLLRVFLSCEEGAQIERIMERDRLTREEAIQKINKVTRERSSYYNQLGTTRWGDVKSYDLCLNTDVIGQEETVAIIVSVARKQ